MFGFVEFARINLLEELKLGYKQLFDREKPHCLEFLLATTDTLINQISQSTALYHNAEHTILVTLVGQEILKGKHQVERNVSPEDWLHYLLALLCHDMGFIRGACERDDPRQGLYYTGRKNDMIQLSRASTDASLTPYHVARSQQFIAEFIHQGGGAVLQGHTVLDLTIIDVARIQAYVERTRFPVPDEYAYQHSGDYPGLTRAADLIGQLSDPLYLQKTTALFYEFEETGANKTLGYRYPDDVWLGYPQFFHTMVRPYLDTAIHYLEATERGQILIRQLEQNVAIAEQRKCDRQAYPPHQPPLYPDLCVGEKPVVQSRIA